MYRDMTRNHHHRREHGRHERGERDSEAWGGRRRLRHGDVRAALVVALTEGPTHGYELGLRLERRSSGAWRPSPGSIYPTLQLLSDEGLVVGEDRDGKRIYALTSTGRAEAAERTKRGEAMPWESDHDDGTQGLRETVHEVRLAAKQVSAAGDDTQRGRAKAILLEARRQLYELLAKG
jgi:DNA-binding PadR family transcriptional regulator